MNVEQMRQRILDAYPGGPDWVKKIRNKSDNQIIAMYNRMVREGKIKS